MGAGDVQAGTFKAPGVACTPPNNNDTFCAFECLGYLNGNGITCSAGADAYCSQSECYCSCSNPDISCLSDSQCGGDTSHCCLPFGLCLPVYTCMECTNNSHCGSGEACLFGVCTAAGCTNTSDCDPGFVCDNGQCKSGNAGECDPSTPNVGCSAICGGGLIGYCAADATCQCYPECVPGVGMSSYCTNTSCPQGQDPVCQADGRCGCGDNPLECHQDTCQALCGNLATGICVADGVDCLSVPGVTVCHGDCMCALGTPAFEEDLTNKVSAYDGPIVDLESLITNIYRIMIPAAIAFYGIPAIGLGGYKILTSQGDPGKVKEGKEDMTAGVVGTLFLLAAVNILAYIIRNFLGYN